MEPVFNHSWTLTPREAIALQQELRLRIRRDDQRRMTSIKTVAALDVSYSRKTDTCYGAVVVIRRKGMVLVDSATAMARSTFPYVPGLLSFREIPPLMEALAKLKIRPDALLIDGQGLAHPRRLGLACHLGLLYDIPSVGCAKSLLCGVFKAPPNRKGAWTPLRDKKRDEIIGSTLLTRPGVKPVYVSVGHLCDDPFARRLILSLLSRYRLPDPSRMAHILSNETRRAHEPE